MRVLVAGGTTEIGEGICRRLMRAGWKVAIGGHAVHAAALASRAGSGGIAVPGDGSSPAAAAALVDRAAEVLGGLEGLVICQDGRAAGSVFDVALQDWDAAVASGPRTVFTLVQAAHRHLKATRGSVVVVGAAEAVRPVPGDHLTSAILAGSAHLVRVFALELAGDGIRVNAVSSARSAPEPVVAGQDSMVGLVTPEDAAGAVFFLLGSQASYISGQNIVVDGGMNGGVSGRNRARGGAG